MQSSGKDKNTLYRINHNNPAFLESLEALSVNARKAVERIERDELLIDPFPRPSNPRLIKLIRWRDYKDIYRIHIILGPKEKYRYVYRVEGTTIHSWYVKQKGRDTYDKFRR